MRKDTPRTQKEDKKNNILTGKKTLRGLKNITVRNIS